MIDFQTKYLSLLKTQVEEEINFLVNNGHSDKDNFKPCMFCYETKDRGYDCNRLTELRNFHSNISITLPRQITHKRRGIGFSPKPVDTTHLQLPQLMQPF